tara:strand:+ start:126 stop:305 length:180 start_codon:yes stop_codon:yes gene_type:complete
MSNPRHDDRETFQLTFWEPSTRATKRNNDRKNNERPTRKRKKIEKENKQNNASSESYQI